VRTGFCPFDLERRPCGEHACALYVQVQYQNDRGETRDDWACAVVASVKLQFHAVMETARLQASLDKTATVAAQGVGSFLSLAAQAARARALTNGEAAE
jgi:hypothetical protein